MPAATGGLVRREALMPGASIIERWVGRGIGPRLFRHRFAWLLLAAALPLALVGLVTQVGASDRQAQALAQAREQSSRALADSLFERLLAARELMQAHAGEARARGLDQARGSSVFVELERVAPVASVAGDSPASPSMHPTALTAPRGTEGPPAADAALPLTDWWRTQAPAGPEALADGRIRLLVRLAGRPGERADVVLAWPAPDGWWLARLDPLYLWPGANDARAAATCVRTVDGAVVDCAGPEGLASSAGSAGAGELDGTAPPARGAARLLLQTEFGAADWWVWRDVPGAVSAVEATRSSVFGAMLALVAIAVAGVAAFLQTRATLDPMSQLIDGARRLGEDDLGARVAVPSHSELGELASRFNTMASELESRFDAMRGLAAIDREVLGGRGLESALPRVLERLAAHWPEGGVALVVQEERRAAASGRRGAAVMRFSRRRLGGPDEIERLLPRDSGLSLPPEASPASGQVPVGAPPLIAAVAHPDRVGWCWWLPVRLRQREVALLLAWADVPPESPATAHATGLRAIELRDHVSLMLAAQERDSLLLARARQDALTGLLNRSGFDEALDALVRRRPSDFALLAIDLVDPQGGSGDAHAAAAHDELLAAAARRLRDAQPDGAIACRADGRARFLVALPRADSPAAGLDRAVQAIFDALGRPYELGADSVVPGVAMGIALCPEDGTMRTELQARAQLALRAARRDGAGRAGRGGGGHGGVEADAANAADVASVGHARRRFEPALEAAALKKAGLRADLRRAFDSGAFELRWQPRVDARSGCAISAEALLRWRHPQRGLLTAAEFIAVASTSNLAVPIGLWVLEAACRQLVAWRAAGIELERISVNVSPRHLQEPDFDRSVLETLTSAGLQPVDLELEFGEAVMALDDAPLRRRIARLRQAGVHVALDDFGNGFASLATLRELPVDAIKLDANLVQSFESEPTARAMVQAIAGLARSFGLRLVAEGIESVSMAERLRALPCAELQGYAFSAPVDAGAFTRLPCVVVGAAARSGPAA